MKLWNLLSDDQKKEFCGIMCNQLYLDVPYPDDLPGYSDDDESNLEAALDKFATSLQDQGVIPDAGVATDWFYMAEHAFAPEWSKVWEKVIWGSVGGTYDWAYAHLCALEGE